MWATLRNNKQKNPLQDTVNLNEYIYIYIPNNTQVLIVAQMQISIFNLKTLLLVEPKM